MSSYQKPEKDHGEAPVRLARHRLKKMAHRKTNSPQQKSHKIRITLTSRKVQTLEKVCTEIIERAKTKDLRYKGPVRLPTKTLKITTRKTPCGEGSKTWDVYEMRIHKRLIEYVFSLSPSLLVPQAMKAGSALSKKGFPRLTDVPL
jgi:small subunit ribosomal protein S20e